MIIDMILLYSLILAAILFSIYFYIATKDIDEEDENYEKNKELFTFNNFIIFGIIYIFSIPLSIYIYNKQFKKNLKKISEEDHEDIL